MFEFLYTENLLQPPLPIVTEENQNSIDQFKQREDVLQWLKDSHYDEFIARWLIARNWNIDDAALMFTKSMKWRQDNDIDHILEWFPQTEYYDKLMNYWPCSHARGHMTLDEWPIYYERIGFVDGKEVFDHVPEQHLQNFHIYEQEGREQLRNELYHERGHSVGTVFIQDLENIGMNSLYRPAIDLMQTLSDIDKDNYPETVRKVFIINSPAVFPVIFKMLKGFFDKSVIKKFSIHSDNGFDVLSRIIPEDHLPTFVGGTLENVVAAAGSGYDWLDAEIIDIDKVTIFSREVVVEQPDTKISIYFRERNQKQIILKVLKDNKKVVVDHGKIENFNNIFVAKQAGVYTILFDNSNPRSSPKSIMFKCEIVK